MKAYIKQFIYFVIIISSISLTILLYKLVVYPNMTYKLPEGKHILFMGASLLATGIDDSKMTEAINLCHSSEPHMYTYIKLNRILKDNKNIDTVFLGIGPVGLSRNTDEKYFSENTAPYFIGNYYPLFTKKEWSLFINKDPKILIKSLLNSFDEKLFITGKRFLTGTGGFEKLHFKFNTPRAIVQEVCEKEYGNKINLEYLDSINSICVKNKIKLFYVFTPHKKIKPYDFYEEKMFYEYCEKYKNIELLDYSNWYVPDSLRSDIYHLNYWGAQVFTEEIKKRFNIK